MSMDVTKVKNLRFNSTVYSIFGLLVFSYAIFEKGYSPFYFFLMILLDLLNYAYNDNIHKR